MAETGNSKAPEPEVQSGYGGREELPCGRRDIRKEEIKKTIDGLATELILLSHLIHDNPELGFEEHKAVGFITNVLKMHGFEAELNYCGLPTAFRVRKRGKLPGGPNIAFLAEYDALRGVGHGCGHNIIAACGTGAFLGLAGQMEELAGEISLIGTPAEEGGAGKAILLERGGFDGVEYVLMMHPSSGGERANLINRGGRASGTVKVTFHGRAAHSSLPTGGINALSSAISTFNQIDMLRPCLESQDNINGVILEGGTAANIIPERAVCEFCLRAETMKRAEELKELVLGCIRRAGELTGAAPEIETGRIYAERYPNLPMCLAFKANMESLGIAMHFPDPKKQYGSSDIGNVSILIPAIHDYLSICSDPKLQAHSKEFARAAAGMEADRICVLGAKGLAMTGADLLTDERLREEVQSFHQASVPEYYRTGGRK